MPVHTNITTFIEGTSPQLVKTGPDSFKCPFCLREGPYHALIPHLQGHQKTAVKYKEYTVYKCCLDCVPSSHYHCCFCPKVLVRRDQFYIHVRSCPMAGPEVAATTAPPLTKGPPMTLTAPKGPPLTPAAPEEPPLTPAAPFGPLLTPALTKEPPLTPAVVSGPPLTPTAPKEPLLTPALPSGPPLTPTAPKEPPLTPAVVSGPPLTPIAVSGPPLTPTAPKEPPLIPEVISGPSLTPAVISGPPLTPTAPKEPLLTPALPSGPPLTPTASKEPQLTPAVVSGPPLTPAVISGPPLTPAVISGPPLTPAVISGPPLTPVAVVTAPKILLSKFPNTTCCICKLVLNKKNLKTHIQRKHSPRARDITANRHLQSLCDRKSRRVRLRSEPHPQASQETPNSHEKPPSPVTPRCSSFERHETTISVQTNVTTFIEGTSPQLVKTGQDTFKCPLCLREGPYHALVPHLQGHQKTVVKCKEYTVYKCHLDCVPSSHYHCCFCPKVSLRKDLFCIHLKSCPTTGPGVTAPKILLPKLPNSTRGINNSVFKAKNPQLVKTGPDSFQCPLCLREGPYHALVPHLQGHQRSVVQYKEYNIYKCRQDCIRTNHYHCCFCPKVLVRKDLLYIHLKSCPMAGSEVATTAAPPLTPAEPTGPPLTPTGPPLTPTGPPLTPAEPTGPPLTPAEPSGPPLTPAEPSGPPLTPAEPSGPAMTPIAASVTAPKKLLSKPKNTTCRICNLILKKKNLKTHIQRKHLARTRDITANRYLQSLCVDRKRGIFAVLRTFMGPAYYIHVQKCTEGKKPQTICQLDKCSKVCEFTGTSWEVHFNCQHIKSLDYSPVTTPLTVALNQDVLTDLTVNGWLSEDTGRDCLRRKLAADVDGAPLSVEVNLAKDEQRRYFFSVFEPKISSCCRFGRLIVYYNVVKNTWHCPCQKVRKSCAHKAIAMWHLYQLKPDMFTNPETCLEDYSEIYIYL